MAYNHFTLKNSFSIWPLSFISLNFKRAILMAAGCKPRIVIAVGKHADHWTTTKWPFSNTTFTTEIFSLCKMQFACLYLLSLCTCMSLVPRGPSALSSLRFFFCNKQQQQTLQDHLSPLGHIYSFFQFHLLGASLFLCERRIAQFELLS